MDTAIAEDVPMTEEQVSAAPEDSAVNDGGAADLDLGYQVQLDAFSGPLDLLLYLVRRAEVDIVDVPIAAIADQFVATVKAWEDMDLEVAGDFIMMAATLLEIKARTIAPAPETDEEEGPDEDEFEFFDSRDSLIQQLLRYRRFKEAVQLLDGVENDAWRCVGRQFHEAIPDDPDEADGFDLENADPYALFKLWDGIVQSIAGKGPRTVVYDDIPMDERVNKIITVMREAKEGQLDWLLQSVESTIQRIGVVVATLECVRKKVLECNQHEQYGSIYLRFRDEDERNRPTAPLLPQVEDEQGKKKRRRRLPLVTYHGPIDQDGVQQVMEECDDDLVVETDEQRFVRELNEASNVDALLKQMKTLDEHIQAHLVEEGIIEAPPEPDPANPETAEAASEAEAASNATTQETGPEDQSKAAETAGAEGSDSVQQGAEEDEPSDKEKAPEEPQASAD